MNNKTNYPTIKEACNPSNYALKTISNKLPDTGKHEALQLIQLAYEDIHDKRMPYKQFKRFEAMSALQLLDVYKLLTMSTIQQNRKVIDTLKEVHKSFLAIDLDNITKSGGA